MQALRYNYSSDEKYAFVEVSSTCVWFVPDNMSMWMHVSSSNYIDTYSVINWFHGVIIKLIQTVCTT